MRNTFIFIFLLLCCCFSSFAQKSIIINGKIVKDKTASPIESATAYLIHPKDSSVVAYTISDKDGLFKLETKASTENLIFKVSAEGYKEFSKAIDKLTTNIDLGVFKLLEYENKLNEVVVKSTAPPIRVKKDTLEFNASSFKLRPDANVEALLKQLPGVTIDADKKIMVNGKEVNQILVNGKPFFGEDGKVALQNLPSEIIKKVQVSDTKTKEEEFTKQASSSNNASINLTIEKDKNKGFFGKVLGGYGSSDRYESSALLSYFKDKRRISFLASSNNINATGFSMDEVFDNMGGGRNWNSRAPSIGGGTGIIKSNMIGLNYADEWFKGAKSTGNYYFTNSDSENKNRTTELTLLPTGSLVAESTSNTNKEFSKHNADFNLEYDITPATKIIVTPKLEKGTTTSTTDFDKKTVDENNQLINTSDSYNTNETDNTNFQNNISVFTKAKKKGRYFTANFQNENSKNDSNSIINSSTVFTQGTSPDDFRNQNVKAVNQRDKYSNSIRYAEPITDSLSINFKISSYLDKTSNDKKTFDFNSGSDAYNDRNELMTNFISSSTLQIASSVGFAIRKNKFDLSVSMNAFFLKTDFHSLYLNSTTDLNKNFVIPDADIDFNYKLSKSKTFYGGYHSGFWIPKGDYFMPVANLENPLNTFIGNPDIRLQKIHRVNFGFQNYDFKSRSGYYVYSNLAYYDINYVSSSVYNENGKQTTTYANVFGTYESSLGANWNKTIKKNAHTFGLNFGLNTNYNLDKGFTNGQLYSAKTLRVSPAIRLSYDYGTLLSIKPSYNFAYNDTRYKNSSVSARSNKSHNFNVEMTNFWPKNWVFGNDFGYSYNSNISGGYKKDFYLWNTSLSYKFAEDKMTFKVKVYDLLNQNQSTSRTITPTAVVDAENTVLKRYVMFSLLYKFQNFAVKKKN
ncbi:TonB-dependent receptor [Flavobacterium undicola]|uniref:TonB-dependent receptor n=1 Tax=Flavobacterium undicola TaxID=1932779 RepID=UPI0013765E81|nr:TonB-dependent receptor [Flavobacterium undicola]MBA0884800.1 TonB-dependent receptor [Flavobacterium undicola]